MKSEGKLYVCDRCGEEAFFKRTKVESLSGGYEHVGVLLQSVVTSIGYHP